jgi:hypothetical protein
MAWEVELEIQYEIQVADGGANWSRHVYTERFPLESKVPTDKVGDMSYLEYRQVAAQQLLSRHGGEFVMVPTDELKTEYRLIPKNDVIWIKTRTVKTLDKE